MVIVFHGKFKNPKDDLTLWPDSSFSINSYLKAFFNLAKSSQIGEKNYGNMWWLIIAGITPIHPEKITLPQLMNLYEALYDRGIDKQNFRKKILTLNVLEKLTEMEMKNSRKGAFFYKFNVDKYNHLIINGFVFDILSNWAN